MEHRTASSWRPFAEVVTERKAELGLSFRDLERRTKELDVGRGLSAAHLVRLFHGDEDPIPRTIALIARALDMSEGDFLEFHLHVMRARLDERLDFKTAAENFELAKTQQYEPASPPVTSPAPVARGRRRYAAAS
ncbi:MAG: helix-turn-helix transcriptional regulator [Solirubrobacteraceae bacterium]